MLRQITNASLIMLKVLFISRFVFTDVFVHRDAFDDGPGEAGLFNFSFAFQDFLFAPHRAIRDMVQCAYDTRCAGLSYITEFHRIVRAEPSPGLFHPHHMQSKGISRKKKITGSLRPSIVW